MRHPNQDQILGFTAGMATEEEAERMFTHLAACTVCTHRFQALRSIREDFEGSWDEFMAEVRLRARASASPVAVAPSPPILGLAVRGIIDGARRVATVAAHRVAGVMEPGGELQAVFVPAYRGVADATLTPAVQKATEAASRLCGEGDDEQAMSRLGDAAGKDPGGVSAATLDLLSEAEVIGKVIVDSGRGSVSLLVYPDALGNSRGVAVMEPTETNAELQRTPLEPVEGADYLLAEFETVPDGAFHLRLELE